MTTLYDNIGRTYSGRRQSDPRIATAIEHALGDCVSVLNVGAGAGSYEPSSRTVFAVEPSRMMIAQRPPGSAPVVQACAEALPFRGGSFDAVLGVLTVHHWKDQAKGFSECARVARSRVVFLTNDFDVCAGFWLFDYIPELILADRHIFPNLVQDFPVGDRLISRVGYHPDGFTGGAEGDDSYASFFLLASFRALTPR